MSIPFSIVTCSDCDLRGSTLQLAGLFRWRDRTGRSCHMARTMGFCPDCDALVAMEVLPTPGDLEDARTQASEHRAYNAKLASPWGRLRNALATFPRRPVAIDDPEILDAVHRLRRKPACLRCGSSEGTALPWPKDISTRDESLHRLGLRHPGCGGELLVHGSGSLRVAPALAVRTYDIHGQLIESIPYDVWRRASA